jgi:thiosulfate dehydrogenase [quinone] large subunit
MSTHALRRFRLLSWPFRSPFSSPLWLVLRMYLGLVWMNFGLGKIRAGWLTSNPLRPLLTAVAEGQTQTPLDFYTHVAGLMVDTGADGLLSVLIPLAEVAVAISFFSGVLLVPAAIIAIGINLNLILAGIASVHFDGRIILMQVLLLAAWRVAGLLGLGTLVRRIWPRVHPVRRATA